MCQDNKTSDAASITHLQRFQLNLFEFSQQLGAIVNQDQVDQFLETKSILVSPHTFYLALDIKQQNVFWCNLQGVWPGKTRLSIAAFLQKIHPAYQDLYLEFGAAAYQMTMQDRTFQKATQATYSIQIPFERHPGEYWWVNQVTQPLGFDAEGHMVSHLNTYHFINLYNDQAPQRPIIYIGTLGNDTLEKQVLQVAKERLEAIWLRNFTPMEKAVVHAYCYLMQNGQGSVTAVKVAEYLKKSELNIKDVNKAILKKAKSNFQLMRFREARDIARLFIKLFG